MTWNKGPHQRNERREGEPQASLKTDLLQYPRSGEHGSGSAPSFDQLFSIHTLVSGSHHQRDHEQEPNEEKQEDDHLWNRFHTGRQSRGGCGGGHFPEHAHPPGTGSRQDRQGISLNG